MSLAEIKKEIEQLSADERKQLTAFLFAKDRFSDAQRSELARRIDDRDPRNWVTLEEAEKRLS